MENSVICMACNVFMPPNRASGWAKAARPEPGARCYMKKELVARRVYPLEEIILSD